MSFSPSLPELRRQVDDHLDHFLSERSTALPEARALIEEIGRLVRLGGKRLRPAFAYWGYRAAGGKHGEEIVASASSLELLHTFALVHDDIMDNAVLRRGEKTTREVYGDSFALLTGDLALVLADAAFMGSGFEASILERAFALYSRMRQEVIAGQFLDLTLESAEEVNEDRARRVALLKSGLYSVVEPLSIGAVLAGSDDDLIESLRRLARPLGEAFQLRDDLLGIFGDSSVIGKSTDSDIREGKRHLLFVKAVELATDDDRSYLEERWGASDLTDEEVERLRGIVDSSGARQAIEELVAELAAEARSLLQALPISNEARAALNDLVGGAVEREA